MVKAAREGKHLRVVDDQTVAPTPTDDLAVQLATILEAGRETCALGTLSCGESWGGNVVCVCQAEAWNWQG